LAYNSVPDKERRSCWCFELPWLAKPTHDLDVERRVAPRSMGLTHVEWDHTEAGH